MSNLSIVGTENAANLYISRISVNSSSPMNPKSGINGTVEFKWFNMLQSEGKPAFDYFTSNRHILEIVVVEIYNKNVLRDVVRGRTLGEKQILLKRAEKEKLAKTTNLSVPKRNPGLSDLKKDSLTAAYLTHKFKLESSVTDFYIYAYFKFGRAGFGPTVIEKVFENGQMPRDSFAYKIEKSNTIWTGPIHSQGGQVMGGSFHMPTGHPSLQKVNNLNFKLKDYRIPTEFVEIQGSTDNRQISNVNFFSKIRHCQTENKKLNFMFSINTKEMIIKSSKYSAALRKYNKRVFEAILPFVKIKEITVLMSNTDGRKRHIATSREADSGIKTVYNYIDPLTKNTKESFVSRGNKDLYSILEEVNFTKNSDIRTFRCQVNEREVSTIKVFVELFDPFEKYLYGFLEEIKNNKKNLETYDFLLQKRDAFDRETKRFDERYLADAYDGQLQYWYNPIGTYLKMLKMTKRISSDDLSQETERVFSYMAPRSCEPASVKHFMYKYKECMSNFVSKYGLRYSNQLSSNFSGGRSGRPSSNIFNIEYDIYHEYNKKVYSSIEHADELFQVPMIRVRTLQQIMSLERAKYNNPDIVFNFSNISAKQAIINSVNSGIYDMFYLSPTRLYNLTSEFEFDNITNLFEEKLAEFNNKSVLDSIDVKSLFGRNVSVEVFEEEENADSVPNIIGNSSDFQSTGSVFQRQNRGFKIPTNVLKLSGKQNNKTFKMLNKLDISTPNNIFSSKSEREAERLPMQIKFLTQKTQIESIFETTQKLLNDKPHIKDLAFFNLFKIVYEDGYEKDSSGEEILGKPIISEMNSQILDSLTAPVICHLVPYEENSLESVDNSFDDYSLANNFFVLIPDDYNLVKEKSAIIEQHAPTLGTVYRKYVSSSLFETEFLRTYDNVEPLERKEQIRLNSLVKKEKPRRDRSLLSRVNKDTPAEKKSKLKKDKYTKNEEKLRIMAEKTVTRDNKTTDQIMRKNTKKEQNRLETKKLDQRDAKKQETRKEERQERREERQQNRTSSVTRPGQSNTTSSSNSRSSGTVGTVSRTGGGRAGTAGRTGTGGRTGTAGRTGGGRAGTGGRTGGGRTGGGRSGY